MQLRYLIPLLMLSFFSKDGYGQENKPKLNEHAAQVTITNMATPAAIQTFSDPNWIRTYTPVIPMADAASINTSSSSVDVKQNIVYTDGFNQPYQAIFKDASNANGQERNLIQIFDNRPQPDQYGFLPYATADLSLNVHSGAFQEQRNFYNALYPDEGYTSFSKSTVSSTPAEQSTKQCLPGKGNVGVSNGIINKKTANLANQVIIWNLDASGLPVFGGYYAAGELMGMETINTANQYGSNDVNSPRSRYYKDKDGNTIMKMVADNAYTYTSGGVLHVATEWKYTYYVYGNKGELRYILPPKAIALSGNNVISSTVLNNLCFQYRYDNKGRVTGSRKPGESDFTRVVYDRKNRPVMRQTPNEHNDGEWEVTYYDINNRIKATSVITLSMEQTDAQTALDNWTGGSTADLFYYLNTDAGEFAVPQLNSIAGNTMMSYSWYDNYDQADPTGAIWNTQATLGLLSSELLQPSGAETPYRSLRTEGLPIGSKIRILAADGVAADKVGDWRTTVNYYDDKGRVIYTVSQDMYNNSPIHQHFTSSQYDFAGRVLISKHVAVNNNSADGVLQHTEFNKSTYHGITGQVLKTWHKSDNSAWTISCAYVYDELGRVSKKSLGNGGEVQDIGYDINGRLKGINAVYAETGNKQGVSRSFGESIKYDYGFDNVRFDGKIAGIVWRGSAADKMNAYGYSYALDGSLLNADFNAVNADNPTWGKNGIDYSVDNIAYDKNGNLTSMFQKGTDLGTNTQDYVDMLEYQYEDNGASNRLQSVVDNAPIINDELGDFKNDNMGNTGDYDYDANGNLVRDANKNIGSDVAVTYTRFNKPAVIRFDNGGVIYNSYDAVGNKVQEVVYDPTVGTTKAKDYIGNYVYDEDALSYALTADGRTVYENGAPVREEFFVKDHLGNVRSTVNVISYQIRQYLASYEIASSNLENLIFDGIDQVRDYKPGGMGDNTMAANLDGADPEKRIGSSLLVHVMAGDNVNLHVNTYYNGYDSEDDNPVNAQDMLESVITTLTGGQGGFEGSESHEVSLVDKVFSPDNYLKFADLVNTQGVDAAKPKAFLNYILFNERMEVVSLMTGAIQANGDGTWSEIGTATALEVPENGYLAVYLSNASQQVLCPGCSHVYFDQLRVEISKGNLLEETHYYPFGLPIAGLGSVDVPQNFKENQHKYQGNEYIKAIGLNWMDFQARQYDPQIGRFLGVDPLAASGGQDIFSPYAAMGNAPESTIDPNGEMFQPVKGATSFYAANDKLYRGDEGGPGSGGGGGSGTGGDAIWAALSAFGLEGSANIIEYAAKKQQEAMTGAENNQDQAPVANGEGTNNEGKNDENPDPQSGGNNSNSSGVQILIWDKDEGLDVGHVAIKIGTTVYGYYPTDEDGDGKLGLKDLTESKGNMHIDDANSFKRRYKGDIITSYDVLITDMQTSALSRTLNRIAKNPGVYSLTGNNCTSVAINALIGVGVQINAPVRVGDRPIFTGETAPIINGFYTAPFGLNNLLQLYGNQRFFINRLRFEVR